MGKGKSKYQVRLRNPDQYQHQKHDQSLVELQQMVEALDSDKPISPEIYTHEEIKPLDLIQDLTDKTLGTWFAFEMVCQLNKLLQQSPELNKKKLPIKEIALYIGNKLKHVLTTSEYKELLSAPIIANIEQIINNLCERWLTESPFGITIQDNKRICTILSQALRIQLLCCRNCPTHCPQHCSDVCYMFG